MEKKEPEKVGDVLRMLFEETSLQDRLEELQAADLWSKITGDIIAAETGKPTVRNKVMYVSVKNASLRNELYMSRTSLRDMINSHFGKEIIKEIKFLS